MKKIISILLTITLLLSLGACTHQANEDLNQSAYESVPFNPNSSDIVSTDGSKDEDASDKAVEESSVLGDGQQTTNSSESGNNSSTSDKTSNPATTASTSSKPKPSSSSSKTETEYEKLNRESPVQGKKEWKFHTTDPDYSTPYDPSDLAECCITIDENDHVTLFWNYYYMADNHPEFAVGGNETVKFDGVDYYWFLCYRYEGSCFVEVNGTISIQMKCINDWGYNVNDEIYFVRKGANKLVVTSHIGTEFKLLKGDVFIR